MAKAKTPKQLAIKIKSLKKQLAKVEKQKKRAVNVFGIILIIAGAVLLINSFSGITGFVVLENISDSAGSILGVVLIVSGILITMSSRMKESDLERRTAETRVMISRKALDRASRDKKVKKNLRDYINEISKIKQSPAERPQERLGEFLVSPRGRAAHGARVAWHYDSATNTLYIDDLLYHKREGEYVDNWATKASHRQITKKDYEKAGYREYAGKI